jgi:hypothetical protein
MTGGVWSSTNGVTTWSYAVSVPTAVSLSFHAFPAHLPQGAMLSVRSGSTTVVYRPADIKRGGLWSRIQPGDTLEFKLSLPTAERSALALQIISLQAGYRSLGADVPDHPYYRQLKRIETARVQSPASGGNASCVQNYMCSMTSANTPAGQGTAALVISNAWQCTGTLINDVPEDNTPYLLTARHCENGTPGANEPGQAADVTVYWDAVTPCGQMLGSIYDPSVATQTGASTVVEQQDAWLIELDDSPIVSDAQFAGFDASGNTITGGYTIHHALGNSKQFTTWYGQALSVQQSGVLGVQYLSDFWEVVNQLGTIGPGASGSSLIDQKDHLVGSLTLGRTTADPSGYESCPVNPLIAPNGSNGSADFTALAAVWNSTADTTSGTGAITLKSVLDPNNTGTLVVPSMPVAPISFTSSNPTPQAGQTLQLTWNAPNATECTASGGIAGDGWSGTLAASGSQSVSETAAISVMYQITCALSGGRHVSRHLTVFWYGSVPFVDVYIARSYVWVTRPAIVTWSSNVSPCSISGGSVSLSNQPSSGSFTTTQSTTGDVTYQVTCGSGTAAASGSTAVSYITPSLTLQANATDRILGEVLGLQWLTWADSCAPSGGAPNDGWATNSFGIGTASFYPRVATLGSYTYTLTCSSGPLSVTRSVQVTVENNAAYVTASLSPSSTTYTASPADYVTVNWTTNLSQCGVNSTPVLGNWVGPTQVFPAESGFQIDGPAILAPNAPGTYTLSVTCSAVGGPTVTSAPMTVTIRHSPPPTASISVTPSTLTVGRQFTVNWSSTYTSDCTATGNVGGSGALWLYSVGVSGSSLESTNEPGQFTIGITCSSIDSTQGSANAQTTVTINEPVQPTISATATASQLTVGQSFTLSWSATNATACTASGGGANGTNWSGTIATSGSLTQTATTAGTFTYTVTCSDGNLSSSGQQTVIVSAATESGGGSNGSGGKGGGGGLTLGEIAALAALVLWRQLANDFGRGGGRRAA